MFNNLFLRKISHVWHKVIRSEQEGVKEPSPEGRNEGGSASLLGRAQLKLILGLSSCPLSLGREYKGRSSLTLVREFPGECEGFIEVRYELAVAQCFLCVVSGFSQPPWGSKQWLVCLAVTMFGMAPAVWGRHQCNGPVALHLNPQGLQSPVCPALSDAQFGLGCVGGTKAAPQLSCGTGCASAHHPDCVTSRDLLPFA